jgi:hypothetical protein
LEHDLRATLDRFVAPLPSLSWTTPINGAVRTGNVKVRL